MRTDTFLAWRFLREGRAQTLLVLAGTTLGVTVVFFLTALVAAVERTMIAQTVDVIPHVVVRRPDETVRHFDEGKGVFAHVSPRAQRLLAIPNWQAVLDEVERTTGVTAASPTLSGPAIASRGAASRAVTVVGIERARFEAVIAIAPRIRRGTWRIAPGEVVLGTELARDLGIDVGDRLSIAGDDPTPESFVVAAVFDLGNRDLNRRLVLVALRQAQSLLQVPGGVSAIEVRAADIWQADGIARTIASHTRQTAESWTATNAQLTAAIQSQRGATVMIRSFVSLAVAVGIASVLIVSVLQKSRQIGILRAMGMTRVTILRAFLIQGAMFGLVGAMFGSGLGSLLAIMSERSSRNPDGSVMYPIQLPASLYLSALGLALVAGVIASVLPARRAALLDPANAIRHE